MTFIIGADEVGRGCLAGPVAVGAVMVPADMAALVGVADSKKLSATRRLEVAQTLRSHPDVRYAVSYLSARYIDKYGIVAALQSCFSESISKLLIQEPGATVRIDGLPIKNLPFEAKFIVKGDGSDWVIGAASILAKVERDACMVAEANQHPPYGWDKNMGYGTTDHIAAIREHGLSDQHRASFCKAFVPTTAQFSAILDIFGA